MTTDDENTTANPNCPECGAVMCKTLIPMEAGYDTPFFFVCFNDDCSYYVRGWKQMWDQYRVKSSYRLRINPLNGKSAPLPVWSKTALKDRIVD